MGNAQLMGNAQFQNQYQSYTYAIQNRDKTKRNPNPYLLNVPVEFATKPLVDLDVAPLTYDDTIDDATAVQESAADDEVFITPAVAPAVTPAVAPAEVADEVADDEVFITPAVAVTPAEVADDEVFITPAVAVTPAEVADDEVFITPAVAVTPAVAPAEVADDEVFITPAVAVTPAVAPAEVAGDDVFITPAVRPSDNEMIVKVLKQGLLLFTNTKPFVFVQGLVF